MIEKRWKAIPSQSFTANGTTDGKITVANAAIFRVKQQVILTATSLPNLDGLEVKRVTDRNTLYVGPIAGNIDSRTDISAYTTALSAAVFANGQLRSKIPEEQIERITYEEEPIVARRVWLVDDIGNVYNASNPLPVAATFDGDVNVGNIRITACDDDPVLGDIHSSVRISDCNNDLKINPDGSINVAQTTGSSAAPTIANEVILLANTEYSYALPAGTKQFSIKDRAGDAKTRIAYTAGDTNTVYKTIDMGCTYDVGGITTPSSFIVYFQSNKAGRVLEIVSWA